MAPDPAVVAARAVARDVLAPAAAATDRAPLVPRHHLDALAAAGLYGLQGPGAPGSTPTPRAAVREATETLAEACAATTFVWLQHHWPVRFLARSANDALRERHLADLCAGRTRGGVAATHLRRPGPRAVRAAVAPGGGYRLEGRAPWVTGWGLVDLVLVGAGLDDGRILLAFVGADAPGQDAQPFDLAVLQATSTVAVDFDGTPVAQADVVAVVEPDDWEALDRVSAAAPSPGTFGVPRAVLALLRAAPEAGDAAAALAAELDRCRATAYRLIDEASAGGPGSDLGAVSTARAWAVDLGVRAAHTAVSARGGRALLADDPGQRLLREAGFWSVQAQDARGRDATSARSTAISAAADLVATPLPR